MDEEKNRQEIIEKYLDGTLPAEEQTAFEAQLSSDEVLQQEVADERLVREAMWRMREEELRAKMRQWKAKPAPQPWPGNVAGFIRNNRNWLLLLLAFVIGSIIVFLSQKTQPIPLTTPDEEPSKPKNNILHDPSPPLDTTNHHQVDASENPAFKEKRLNNQTHTIQPNNHRDQPANQHDLTAEEAAREKFIYSSPLASRQGSTSAKTDSLNAILKMKIAGKKSLDQKDYLQALEQLQQADYTDDEVRYWTAEALFGNRQYEAAAVLFQNFTEHFLFGVDAQKNLVLCYLAQYPGKQKEFTETLQTLKQSRSKSLREWAAGISNSPWK